MSKVAAALPELAPASEPPVPQQTDSPVKNPQEHGWVAKTNYDYNTYNKTTKELSEESAAVSAGGGDDAIMGVQVRTLDVFQTPLSHNKIELRL